MKTLFIIIFGLSFTIINGQSQNDSMKLPIDSFYLKYAYCGLGSNLGTMQPKLIINNEEFIYTYEQNSYWERKCKEPDTICVGFINISSIDSIIRFVADRKDKLIFKTNPCIISGGIHNLEIVNKGDTIKYEMHNTFDYTVLEIVRILNNYLPPNKKLWPSESMIKEEKECWEILLNE